MTFGSIESANIVGYTTKDAPKGSFIILGAQFEGVAGGTAVNDILSGVPGVSYDEEGAFKSTASQIQIPDGVGYKTLYYLNDGWMDDGSADGVIMPGWCDNEGVIAETEVTPGVAIWLKSVGEASNAVVAGAVSSEDSVVVDCPAVFALRANAFPMAVAVNGANMAVSDIKGADYDEGGAFKQTAPQIQIPNGVGYTTRYYLNDGWMDDGSADGVIKAGWCDNEGVLGEDEIPAAQGFWTKGTGSAFKVTFTK